MTTKDISRLSFDPRKHYSSVRMQQGRVMIDDDWNENERIENEDRRRARVEIVGPSGSPDQGFRITNPEISTEGRIDFEIEPGSFYLGGLRLEIEQKESYRLQKDWLRQPSDLHPAPEGERYDLVYLEAWQQPVGAVEDGELFEVALGGADTSMRIRNMSRVRLEPGVQANDCTDAWWKLVEAWKVNKKGTLNKENERATDASLKVTFVAGGNPGDLCAPFAAGGYMGVENQAIRVQIVDQTRLTWGFDNAAPLYRVSVNEAGETVSLKTDPKDQAHWPLAGQTVEILPWSAVLPNGEKVSAMEGHLSKVESSFNPDSGELTLTSPVPAAFGKEWTSRDDHGALHEPSFNFFLRVWNRGADRTSPEEIPFAVDTPVRLGETGLEITISGNELVSGNYWVIAARPETPNQVVPWELERGLAPHGIRRYYAPLALIHWKFFSSRLIQGEIISDCRDTFLPLMKLQGCCTFTVGDGVKSHGHFNSLETALDNLPLQGGKIRLLPGCHRANVTINEKMDIRISGCGSHTLVYPNPGREQDPVFMIENSQRIEIDDMTLISASGHGIHVEDQAAIGVSSREILIHDNRLIASVRAIFVKVQNEIAGNNHIRIMNNEIGMLDKAEGGSAIYIQADDVLIERNRIIVIPAPDPDDPADPRDPDDPDGFYDPCADMSQMYTNTSMIFRFMYGVLAYMSMGTFTKRISYVARGGIQIGGGSEEVKIIRNMIIGGNGNGITLGHVPVLNPDGTTGINNNPFTSYPETTDKEYDFLRDNMTPFVYGVAIEDNMIANMGLSGIGVPAFFKTENVALMLSVEDLTVYRNRIEQCAHLIPDETHGDMLDEIGFGGIVLAACENAIIRENRIENNGINQLAPVCGILILYAEKIDVSDNRIINNGPRTFADDVDARQGLRGGIVIKTGFRQIRSKVLGEELFFPDGVPAVKVHNNIVTHPFGQALFITALGPVSVIGNHFTSQGADYRVNKCSHLAGAVYILNLGISKDLIASILLQGFKYLPAAGTDNFDYAVTRRLPLTDETTTGGLTETIRRILYLPSGNVLFADNRTTLDLRQADINFAFSAQAIASLDDIAYNSNQSECTSLLDFLYTDVALLGVTIRANDNRFQEGVSGTLYSLFSFGLMNMASNNQATHCLQVFGVSSFTQASANSVLYRIGCSEQTKMVGTYLVAQAVETAV
ncbi:MAG: hypothetical protein GY868_12830 [Deltaproteobacteria bacterium]|nr:hypothetical protein [Deltaproteobacteria bacterium]